VSAGSKPLVGSPEALGRLFAGGILSWRQFPMRLSRAQRVARRKEIFGSFTRAIAHAPHPVAVLRGQEGDRVVVQEKPARSFTSAKKREARRLAALRARATAIPRSNRQPRKGPSAEKRGGIKRREAKRIAHEAKTKARGEARP